ncbi:uncharacterized protein SCHCODRAFT_01168136 [Schizophyllum commune H4-8]|uniref:Uncharacterized protein n=1 Tax=Schizophyllum commune (strain H4-8 / FGSC 9210) TaxID=578458 RepID=D8PVS0_SCHCM|nr:uncharacterized protein SCHCODRAFT_01168136 [Schizophyllum commune H4-8]KAI5900242.1 hypothetical protein SCHCODRAFT_01168136 [Schizophyllum commune H4-8]
MDGQVAHDDSPNVIITEPRAATEARLASLRTQLTNQAGKLLNPHLANVLVRVIFEAIAAALKATLWVGKNPTVWIAIGGGALTAILMPILGPAMLGVIGFGSAGIVAGSLAALIQASIGNVAAGSVFAALQAAGATGTIPAAGVHIAGVVGTAATGGGKMAYDFAKAHELDKKAQVAGLVACNVGKKAYDIGAGTACNVGASVVQGWYAMWNRPKNE